MNVRFLPIYCIFFQFLAIQANVLREISSEFNTNLSDGEYLLFEDEPILRRSVTSERRFKEHDSRREKRNGTSHNCVNDWPSLPSIDEMEGTWKVETKFSRRTPESDCLRLVFRKHNSTSMTMKVLDPIEILENQEAANQEHPCYVAGKFYSCFENLGDEALFRFSPQTPVNRYVIMGMCAPKYVAPRHEYIVLTRENDTLLSDDLNNLESLSQELDIGDLNYQSCP